MRKFKLLSLQGYSPGKWILGNVYPEDYKPSPAAGSYLDFCILGKINDYYENVSFLAKNFPEDWEEVFEDESPWISVLAELPKQDQEVFVVDEFEEYHVCKYDSFWGFVQDEKKIRPTHWMPLPKLPTNE